MLVGAVQDSESCVSPAAADSDVGAAGTARGVALLDAAEKLPVPTLFTAATRNTYAVPFVRPVTVALVPVDVPSENVVHVDPLFDEYWTM